MSQRNTFFFKILLILFAGILLFFAAMLFYIFKHRTDLSNAFPVAVTETQKQSAKNTFYNSINFNPNHIYLNSIENFLPVQNSLNLHAEAYILVDAKTGTVILQHNADKIIPPASLTKLAGIYTLMKNKKFQDETKIIVPPKESWAVFLPPNSAELGLGKAQQLTVKELFLGMAVCSGNDAAIAAAILAEGSSKKFVEKINSEMQNLGLVNTRFVEPTGLSEKNQTTAKEFAAFSVQYIKEYPENLKRFHSVSFVEYPQPYNFLITKDKNKTHIQYSPIMKPATNTLLKKLEGCDGLKTGFIYESGFNIAVTAERNGTRFAAVILGGAGKSSREGILIREKNGIAIMNFGFDNFKTISIENENIIKNKIIVLGASLHARESAITPITACTDFSETHITVLKNDNRPIEKVIRLPAVLHAPLYAGQRVGQIEYVIKNSNIVLKTIPLICPVDIPEGSFFRKLLDGK